MIKANPQSVRRDFKLGDKFDILLAEKGGDGYSPSEVASVTKKGAMVILPRKQWTYCNLDNIAWMVSHEVDHIGIGQLAGAKASIAYDKLNGHTMDVIIGEIASDIWVRR